MPTRDDWTAAWSRIAPAPPARTRFDQLTAAYSESGRAYHNLNHLDECFAQFARVCDQIVEPAEVALALWFHDVVYDARRSDNEARSAAWAEEVMREAGCAAAPIASVVALILGTTHRSEPGPGDLAVLCDIDLAILGAAPKRFDAYESQIRAEYAWVAEADFRAGRTAILARFLARSTIYATTFFQARLEAAARDNLARSIAHLGPGCD